MSDDNEMNIMKALNDSDTDAAMDDDDRVDVKPADIRMSAINDLVRLFRLMMWSRGARPSSAARRGRDVGDNAGPGASDAGFAADRGQGRVLIALKGGEMKQSSLGYVLGVTRQALAELVKKLEDGGYVTRHPSATDRRVMMVSLTDRGRESAAALETESGDRLSMFDGFDDDEMHAFDGYLKRIIAQYEARFGGRMPEDRRGRFPSRERFAGSGFDATGFDGPRRFGDGMRDPADRPGNGRFDGGRPDERDERYGRPAFPEARIAGGR